MGATQFMLGPRFTVRYGRCSTHRVRWIKVAGVLAGVALVVGMLGAFGSLMVNNGRFRISEVLFGALFVFAAAILVWARFSDIHLGKVEGGMVWIGGFGRPYLAALPDRETAAT